MTLSKHHLVLYGVIFLVLCVLAGVFHAWRMDLVTAKIKAQAQQETIAQIQKNQDEREKQFEATIAQIRAMKVTISTPAPVRVQRLNDLVPSIAVAPTQLQPPAPGKPPDQLVLTPAQQVTLDNFAVECKACGTERDKLKLDLQDSQTKLGIMTQERDEFKTAAKGGSLRQRIIRRAWHFAEDAIIIEALRAAGGHP